MLKIILIGWLYRYESTGTDFHYECHKNTELEKTEQKWKDTTKKLERNETLMKSLAEICM